MKRLIPLLVLLGGVSGALAQGTVTFDNFVLLGSVPQDVRVRDIDGTPLKNAPGSDTLRVQLLYGTSADSLTPHAGLARFRPSTAGTATAGTWRGLDATDDLNRSLPIGGVNQPIFLQVRAWDATAGNLSFEAAQAAGQKFGVSTPFQYTQTVSSPTPQPSDTWMLNFTGFTLVPEPSVIGLAMVGAGALFLLRRRK